MNRHFRQYFVTALLTLGVLPVAYAAVNVQARPNPVLVGEVFELTVTQSPAGREEPQLLPLPQGLRELQRQSSQSTQIINGQTRTSRSWRIAMVATQAGPFTIDLAELDGEKIAPAKIQVQAPDPAAAARPDVFAEFTASTTRSWVGAEIALHLRVYVAGELDSGSLPHPSAPGLVIENLSESNDGEELIGNTRYRVLDRHYVAFAESPGELTIPGPVFSGQVIDRSRRSRFPSFSVPTRHVSAVAPDIALTINPAEHNPDGAWLPASHVSLHEELDIPGGQAEQGQALTRTVTLQVDGLLHTQLPDLNWPLPPRDMAQSFAEEAQDSTQTRTSSNQATGVRTLRVQRFVHIPQAEVLELPAVHLPWFNTETGQWEQAQLPARRIPVKRTQSHSSPSPSTPSLGPPPRGEERNTESTEQAPETAAANHDPVSSPTDWREPNRIWKTVAIMSSIGWLFTLVFCIATRRKRHPAPPKATAVRNHATVQETRKAAIRAAQREHPQETHQALLAWGRASGLLQGSSGQGLLQLASQITNEDLSREIRALSDGLYGAGSWSGPKLAAALKAWKPQHQQSVASPSEHRSLRPLYPNDE